jgi:L-lactate dehydrogenase
MDIIQGTAFCPPVNIYASDYDCAVGADIVIVTLGMARKPGQTRIDLAQANVNIIKSVMPKITKYAPDAIYVVVSNPVDILTYAIKKFTNLAEQQVLGSGTILDTARLRSCIAERININPHDVHAYVIGEHGDTSVIPWSLATIGGIGLETFGQHPNDTYTGLDRKTDFESIENDVRTSGAKVIGYKGATFYAIALSVRRICECLFMDAPTILTVSGELRGQYEIDNVCLSLPFAVSSQGLLYPAPQPLTMEEEEKLMYSANSLKSVLASLDI